MASNCECCRRKMTIRYNEHKPNGLKYTARCSTCGRWFDISETTLRNCFDHPGAREILNKIGSEK